MKKQKQTEDAAQGAPVLTLEQIKAALDRDFKALHALVNMVRSEPRIQQAMAEVIYQNNVNHQTVKAAREGAEI